MSMLSFAAVDYLVSHVGSMTDPVEEFVFCILGEIFPLRDEGTVEV